MVGAGCSSKPKADTTEFCRHYAAATHVAGSLQHLDAVSVPDIQRQVQAADAEVQAAVAGGPGGGEAQLDRPGRALHTFRLEVDKATTNAEVASAAQRYRTDAATLVAAQGQRQRLDHRALRPGPRGPQHHRRPHHQLTRMFCGKRRKAGTSGGTTASTGPDVAADRLPPWPATTSTTRRPHPSAPPPRGP